VHKLTTVTSTAWCWALRPGTLLVRSPKVVEKAARAAAQWDIIVPARAGDRQFPPVRGTTT